MKRLLGLTAVLIIAGVYFACFTVDQRVKAIVFRFGEAVRVIEEPGLKFKIPFIETVQKYDARILPLDTPEYTITFADNRRLVVDAFSRWRIKDVRKFFVAVRAGGIDRARVLLADPFEDKLRNVLANVNSNDVLSENRTALMRKVLDAVRTDADRIGIEIVDVRITRTDLPVSNLEATVDRMISERAEEAAEQLAKGRELAASIRANAEKERAELVSSAQKESQIIKGAADAERNNIFAKAYGQDPEFFDFYRSLQAYSTGLIPDEETGLDGSTTMVISPDDDFFRFLNSETGAN